MFGRGAAGIIAVCTCVYKKGILKILGISKNVAH